MGKLKGYVFSLDAFVAFSIILLAIQTLVLMTSMPRSNYAALLQAEYLAHDTLQVMQIAKPPCPTGNNCQSKTYLQMISPYAVKHQYCRGITDCWKNITELTDNSIPPQFSYAYFYDDMEGGSWLLYNASEDSRSTHFNVTFRRVQASAQIYLLGYTRDLKSGKSPYCNVVCKGYNPDTGGNAPAGLCMLPCDAPQSNFDPGNFTVGLLRLSVWG